MTSCKISVAHRTLLEISMHTPNDETRTSSLYALGCYVTDNPAKDCTRKTHVLCATRIWDAIHDKKIELIPVLRNGCSFLTSKVSSNPTRLVHPVFKGNICNNQLLQSEHGNALPQCQSIKESTIFSMTSINQHCNVHNTMYASHFDSIHKLTKLRLKVSTL